MRLNTLSVLDFVSLYVA